MPLSGGEEHLKRKTQNNTVSVPKPTVANRKGGRKFNVLMHDT